MRRLLWLAFAAAAAALLFACLLEWLFPKSAVPARWEEPADGLPPFDPALWQTTTVSNDPAATWRVLADGSA